MSLWAPLSLNPLLFLSSPFFLLSSSLSQFLLHFSLFLLFYLFFLLLSYLSSSSPSSSSYACTPLPPWSNFRTLFLMWLVTVILEGFRVFTMHFVLLNTSEIYCGNIRSPHPLPPGQEVCGGGKEEKETLFCLLFHFIMWSPSLHFPPLLSLPLHFPLFLLFIFMLGKKLSFLTRLHPDTCVKIVFSSNLRVLGLSCHGVRRTHWRGPKRTDSCPPHSTVSYFLRGPKRLEEDQVCFCPELWYLF